MSSSLDSLVERGADAGAVDMFYEFHVMGALPVLTLSL